MITILIIYLGIGLVMTGVDYVLLKRHGKIAIPIHLHLIKAAIWPVGLIMSIRRWR